jgi:acyl dehydratase
MTTRVAVGDELPTFERMSSFQHWNRYAAVNYEFVDIHMDDRAGRAAGYNGAFGMGNLQFAYLHNLIRAWAGDEARIVRLGCQFRAPNLNDLRTIARGRVTEVRQEDGRTVVELDVWTETEEGTVMAPGSATVVLPAS